MQLVMRQQQQKMNVRNEGNKVPNTIPMGDDELKTNQVNPPIDMLISIILPFNNDNSYCKDNARHSNVKCHRVQVNLAQV